MADGKAMVRRWFEEVWNQGREETIDELFAADGVAHGLSEEGVQVRGPEAFKPFVRNLRGALPDIHVRVEEILSEGDMVAVRVVAEGTHTGEDLGVPPSGRRVRISGIIMLRVRGNQIAEGWNSWDQLGMLQQIGALPAEDAAPRFITRP